MDLPETFRRRIADLALPPGRAVVAVSGGPDSVALLHLLYRSRDAHGLDLVVAHADHGIHPESSRVAEQVELLAVSYGLPVEVGRLDLGEGASETVARASRYAWLEWVRTEQKATVVFTAHHADDQIETVMMRVIAGSGPAGLAGMATQSGWLVRPLLTIPRVELVRYVEETGLTSWLDPANSDPRHLRSWIRTELLPAVRRRLPEVDANLGRVARQAARDRAAWDAVLDALSDLEVSSTGEEISVAASSLARYASPLVEAVILALARRVGCQLGPARIGRVVELVRHASSGARVPLGGAWTAEVAFDRLRLWRESGNKDRSPWALEGEQGEGFWGRWAFRWQPAVAPARQSRDGLSAWFSFDGLTVRAWSAGEKLKPLGGTGRRLIVHCFQEVRVPRSRRASWPVLARNGEIVWIPGVCRSDALLPATGGEALRVDAEYS